MGCNCKNKNNQNETQSNQQEQTQTSSVEFRKAEEVKPQNKLTMMQSFATAITSRGFNNEKVVEPIKQLRVISCFGNQGQGGILPPCEHLKQSSTPGKFYCGGCGCGDRKGTWLLSDGEEYSKLDYPRLTCPLKMPGFTNYEKSAEDEANPPITRRFYIEQLPFKEIQKIPVKTHEVPANPAPPKETAETKQEEQK